MKKRILSIVLAITMLVCMIPLGTLTAFAVPVDLSQYDWEGVVGDGTEGNPYKIGSKDDLEKLAEIVNAGTNCADTYFVLTGDIGSTNDPVMTVIGSETNSFNGHFNGDGHTVTVESDGSDYCGLFSVLGNGGEIINLTTAGCVSGDGYSYAGGVCGQNNGIIDNCRNTAEVSGMEIVGGVCAQNNGTITNCCNTGTVGGEAGTVNAVGGVCGYNLNTIANCYNTGKVSGGNNIGGVCGYNNYNYNNKCTITNCYNTGTVSGVDYVGGVCGQNCGGNVCATITNCWNTGTVSSEFGDAGGVCGENWDTIANCYNTGTVSGVDYVGGVCGTNRGAITYCYYDNAAYKGNVVGRNEGGTTDYCYGLSATQMKAESKAVLTTSVANDKPLVVLLNEYVTAHSSDNLRAWTNKQGEYPVFGTPHTHTFAYSADGATLTATCSADGCDLKDSKISLTLGEDGEFDADELQAWTAADAAEPQFTYYADKNCETSIEALTGEEISYTVKVSLTFIDAEGKEVTVSAQKRVYNCGFYYPGDYSAIYFALPFETENYPLSNIILADGYGDSCSTGLTCYKADGSTDTFVFVSGEMLPEPLDHPIWVDVIENADAGNVNLANYKYFCFQSGDEIADTIRFVNPSDKENTVPVITTDYFAKEHPQFPTEPGNYPYYFAETGDDVFNLGELFNIGGIERNVAFDIFKIGGEFGTVQLVKPDGAVLFDGGPHFNGDPQIELEPRTLYFIHVHGWDYSEETHTCTVFNGGSDFLHICPGNLMEPHMHEFDGDGICHICYAVKIPDRNGPVFSYDGEAHSGVEATNKYYHPGGIADATDVGSYTAEAVLFPGYVWADGSTEPVEISWSIVPAEVHITPRATWKYFGIADPELEADVVGLIGDDRVEYRLERGVGDDAGFYDIYVLIDEPEQGNYILTAEDGTNMFEIKKGIVPVPDPQTSFDYDGYEKTVLESTDLYTVTGGTQTMYGQYQAEVTLNDPNNYEWEEDFDGTIEWEIVDTIATRREEVLRDLEFLAKEIDHDGYNVNPEAIDEVLVQWEEPIKTVAEDRFEEVFQQAMEALRAVQKEILRGSIDVFREGFLMMVEGLDYDEQIKNAFVEYLTNEAPNMTEAGASAKKAFEDAANSAKAVAKKALADAAAATGIDNQAMQDVVAEYSRSIDEVALDWEIIAREINEAKQTGLEEIAKAALAQTKAEYYLVTAPTTTEKGTYNQRTYYINNEGNKVVLNEKVAEENWECTFEQWYLRTFVQYKDAENGGMDVRFISMLNGECFADEKLPDYASAGFTIQVADEEADVKETTVAYTSFLANGKEVKIDDYSNSSDFFFLENTVFDQAIVDADSQITVTPFVKLADGSTINGKTVTFKLSDLK